MTRRFKLEAIIIFLFLTGSIENSSSQSVPAGFSVEIISSGLNSDAIGFALLPDKRILIIRQSGDVKILVNDSLYSQPILTVPNVTTSGGERGLLGIAIDPDFPEEPYLYLFHSSKDSMHIVSRFMIQGELQNPDSPNLFIDPASQDTLISGLPDDDRLHNGASLRFGSDKTLYISHGDDRNEALVQELSTLHGKILRINRDGSIPSDNPAFPNEPLDRRQEIFAFGLRNPFRFSIDPETDELFIADVGAGGWEELDISVGGENFGWPAFEGTSVEDPTAILAEPQPTFPIWEFPHGGGELFAAIALVAYRQTDFPNDFSFPNSYDGVYFYADFFHDWIRYLMRDENDNWVSLDFGTGFQRLVDAYLGSDGSIYVLEMGESLKKIVYLGGIGLVESPEPRRFAVEQNYPNPFNLTTRIVYELREARHVTIKVFNLLGQEITVLVDTFQPAGLYEVDWNGTDFKRETASSGVYIYKFEADGVIEIRKMLLLK